MTENNISFIIPVFNRQDEIKELLGSFTKLSSRKNFEIVIIEDGSTNDCKEVINDFKNQLNISYYMKSNTGPGDSRNYGMRKAKGNYFIILDSDCLLPEDYMQHVIYNLNNNYVDCFGGVDGSHESFTDYQKAVSFSMTSFLTTGGIRGGKYKKKLFQPRSFNMGISKDAFLRSNGFGNIHPGEDPDLSIRLNKLGFKTALYSDVLVFHKRRITVSSFFKQVYKFGLVRPILNHWHPKSSRLIYYFPTFAFIFLIFSIIELIRGNQTPLYLILIYMILVFISSTYTNRSLKIGLLSIITSAIQILGYGYGYLKSSIVLIFNKKNIQKVFPEVFFSK
ncbi:MAG TPA: glycosyltransferase [Flavobacteriaceae bacterium]|nr:glycosyltransferase [Flavobacteriaceae bacterium]|tara:strand:+ start:3264 stop:4271 length:1008 start_codon:yes stop_codon:yes gene_type:complete